MPDSDLRSRPDKLNDAETVLYEIDMLRFAKERLLAPAGFSSEGEEWLCLEAFLLHFRNLIEFFGASKKYGGDLRITNHQDIWPTGGPEKSILRCMKRSDLYKKYDSGKNVEAISKYLHHCTKRRAIKKKWNVREMYEDLRQVIEKFESLLPEYKPATNLRKPKAVASLFNESVSTASTRVTNIFPDPSGEVRALPENAKEFNGD